MPVGTVTRKGQITIPKEVRDRLRLVPGSRVNFTVEPANAATTKPVKTDFRALKGILKSPFNRPVTIEEMDEAIARGACE